MDILIKEEMNILNSLFIEINNQLLFITDEEELNILLQQILHWESNTTSITHLPILVQYCSFQGSVHLPHRN